MVKPMKVDKVANGLTRKGFVEKQSKHRKFILYINGKKQNIFTVISHGGKEIPKKLVKTMMKQLRFETFEEFEDFVKRPMTYEDYIGLLKKKRHIDAE
ncbi:type II toxin-antitoxin system HicA family toxin [Archaeoglobales archaeon]|nr:MAG: type II toxin-antitoxin system HicA family toxin [Archaeoglobales archaeon]